MLSSAFIKILKTAAFIAVLCIVAGVSAYLAMTLIIRRQDAVIVPDLVGKDVVYALERLSDLGLNTKVSGREFSDAMALHHVLYQDPGPGDEIRKGRDVRLVLSRGPESLRMPDLTGLSESEAMVSLEKTGLPPGNRAAAYSPRVPRGSVMAQYPSPGARTTRTRPVDLLVSRGVKPVMYAMPDLTDLPLEQAVRAAEAMGLSLGEIRRERVRGAPADTVTRQEPGHGSRVGPESRVNLWINTRITEKPRTPAEKPVGVSLFRYRLPPGFLKKHIRIRVSRHGMLFDMADTMASPGREVRILLPNDVDATIFVYEDGELVKTAVRGDS